MEAPPPPETPERGTSSIGPSGPPHGGNGMAPRWLPHPDSGKAGADVSVACAACGASHRGPDRGQLVPGVRLGGRFAGCPPETPERRGRLRKEFEWSRGGIAKGSRCSAGRAVKVSLDPDSGVGRFPRVSIAASQASLFSGTARRFGGRHEPGTRFQAGQLSLGSSGRQAALGRWTAKPSSDGRAGRGTSHPARCARASSEDSAAANRPSGRGANPASPAPAPRRRHLGG